MVSIVIGVSLLLVDQVQHWSGRIIKPFIGMTDTTKPGFEERPIILIRMLVCLAIVGRIAFGLSRQMSDPISMRGLYGANEMQASYMFWAIFIGSLLMLLITAIRKPRVSVHAYTVIFGTIGYMIVFYVLFYTAIPLIKVTPTEFSFEHLRILKTSAEEGFNTGFFLALPVVAITAGLCFLFDRLVSGNSRHALLAALGFAGLFIFANLLFYDWLLSGVMVVTLLVAGPLKLMFWKFAELF